MSSSTRSLEVLLLLCVMVMVARADQPRMNSARTHLQQARAELQVALRNKGGHRARAIAHINNAIAEINAGVRFDRRHNHAPSVSPDQPHMQRALDHLREAKDDLQAASNDKGGHRVKALAYVNDAIDEVKKGIDAGE